MMLESWSPSCGSIYDSPKPGLVGESRPGNRLERLPPAFGPHLTADAADGRAMRTAWPKAHWTVAGSSTALKVLAACDDSPRLQDVEHLPWLFVPL